MEQKPFRFEFKYIIDPARALGIEAALRRFGMEIDPHVPGGNDQYTVTSLYFDSLLLGDYYDKAGGFPYRKKVRARIYDPVMTDKTERVWFEIKKKRNMSIAKDRLILTNDQWKRFSGGELLEPEREGWSAADAEVWNKLRWLTAVEGRRPTVFVRYTRKPYVARFLSDFRITFDSHIEACRSETLEQDAGVAEIAPRQVVLEVKYAKGMPYWWGEIVRQFHLSRTSFSKYAMGIESLYRYNALPR